MYYKVKKHNKCRDQGGVVEVWWVYNPQVLGSKLGFDTSNVVRSYEGKAIARKMFKFFLEDEYYQSSL